MGPYLFGALALILLGATSADAPAEPTSAATAQIMFLDAPEGRRGPDILSLQKDNSCAHIFSSKTIGRHNMIGGNVSGPVEIPAGAPTELHAHARITYGAYITRTCQNTARFTPEAGHLYDVSHPISPKGECSLEIKDHATGQTPASYKVLPKNCGKPED